MTDNATALALARPPAVKAHLVEARPRRTRFGERLLLWLSRDPRAGDYPAPAAEYDVHNALRHLHDSFPDFASLIRGQHVLDFGCGLGYQAVALVLAGARSVVGVDTNQKLLAQAKELAGAQGLRDRVTFVERLDDRREAFDVVISQNSMEHFPDPGSVLQEMKAVLRLDGQLLVTFSPPWYAPNGAHLGYFTRVPWAHLLFSERTVMAVRARFRNDGARRYEEVEGGLSRMSLAKFERLVRASGFRPEWIRYDAIKKLKLVNRLPLLRELLVNRVVAVLVKPGGIQE